MNFSFSHTVCFKTSALIDLADLDNVHDERDLVDDTDTTVVLVELYEDGAVGVQGRTDPNEWILLYDLY